jgi:hypothetical protein
MLESSSNDPFSGVWTLRSQQSDPPFPVPQKWTHRIAATAETIQVHEEIITAGGLQPTISVAARFDGQDYPVVGSPRADAIAYTRTDTHTISGFGKKESQLLWRETASVSADGLTLTIKFVFAGKNGASAVVAAVFEKSGELNPPEP